MHFSALTEREIALHLTDKDAQADAGRMPRRPVPGRSPGIRTEGRRKRFIKSAFKQYRGPKGIDPLLQHPERLSLRGERWELTIFLSALQGFAFISEGMSPEARTGMFNNYLSAVTDIIHY